MDSHVVEESFDICHQTNFVYAESHQNFCQHIHDVWSTKQQIIETDATCFCSSVVTDAGFIPFLYDVDWQIPSWLSNRCVVVDWVDFHRDACLCEFIHFFENAIA